MSVSASGKKTARREIGTSDIAPELAQRAASDPQHSVWVAASAGSGKTTVLTKRVLRLLLSGVKPQKILCLTFTRAAAAEMAIRVTDSLSLWATCSDEKLRAELDELQGEAPKPKQLAIARQLLAQVLSCPGGMRIRTIHAFCQEILGRFPIEAGLPPHFSVIDEADAQELIENTQRDFLHQLQEKPSHPLAPSLKHLAHDLGEGGFAAAVRNILRERRRLDTAVAQAGNFDQLIADIRRFLELEPGEDEQSVVYDAVDFSVLPQAKIKQAAQRLLEGSKMYRARGERILDWLSLSHDKRIGAFGDYRECFLKADAMPRAEFANKDLLQSYPDLGPVMEREAMRLQSVMERLEAAGIATTTEAVLRIGRALTEQIGRRKAARAALDYDDLIIRTDALLHRPGIAPWVLYKLDGGIDHIMIDEAQDTSRAQWRIVKALADEFFGGSGARSDAKRTLFVVGDEKQSIFSFQNADPDAFAEMRDYFARRLDETGDSLRLIPMHTSFRSAPAILKAVDGVFAISDAQAGVSSEPMHHTAAQPRRGEAEKIGRVEVWPLLPAAEKEPDSDGSWSLPTDYEIEADPQADLAATIALTIDNWLKNGARRAGTQKRITPGDIMILLRNRGRFADLMVRTLKQRGVPVTGVDRMRLTEQLPVMDLLALIQFVLLPEDDLNLAAVLRGPLLACSEEQLMELAIGREGSLWRSLTAKAQANASFATMANYLLQGLNEADFKTPFAFLARILNEPCPGNVVSGRKALWARLGPDALDPIEELLNAAQDFGQRHAPSLQTFLHRMLASETTIKRELDRSEGQVRIMTAHGAKGLEAPIVFLPDTSSLPRPQDVPELLWNADGLPLYLARKPQSGVAFQLWSEARRKQLEEYRRLLYVALTRAAERLYIGGWEQTRQERNAAKSWYALVKDGLQNFHEPSSIAEGTTIPDICFADPILRQKEKPETAQKILPAPVELPTWARQPGPNELGLLDILSPSHLGIPDTATPDSTFTRGRIIHRLLQSLPDRDESERANAAARFLANPRHNLTPQQQQEIRTEVVNLLNSPDYAPLFGPDSSAEVPLTGQVAGHVISGQVDRLCIRGDEVWIIDYKTSRPPPAIAAETPPAYRRQLAAYRAALQEIYPGKTVRCFLLWTYGPQLMELPGELLTY